jgi:phosphorylcholine metabolism protein LicD
LKCIDKQQDISPFDKGIFPDIWILAQMETNSFAMKNSFFCCYKRATRGSSFYGLQKRIFHSKLAVDSWKTLQILSI